MAKMKKLPLLEVKLPTKILIYFTISQPTLSLKNLQSQETAEKSSRCESNQLNYIPGTNNPWAKKQMLPLPQLPIKAFYRLKWC